MTPLQTRNRSLEHYGMIGNLRTVALVSDQGSIDWCCLPDFSAPSVFGALLDADRGGRFQIAPAIPSRTKQFYISNTNVLVTRFITADGVGEITDFMTIVKNPREEDGLNLHRIVRTIRGRMTYRLDCVPAFDYGREKHRAAAVEGGLRFDAAAGRLTLFSPKSLRLRNGSAHASWVGNEGESTSFVLHFRPSGKKGECMPVLNSEAELHDTMAYWRHWTGRMNYNGRWRESVTRSALVLKLLTFGPTGAIVASPTTSLPESPVGGRNWDYRYTWIRDSSFTLRALLRLGFHDESKDFMGWLQGRLSDIKSDGALQPIYGIRGEAKLPESELKSLRGYNGMGPVRVGNAAFAQHQLDIYGELMDSIYLFNKHVEPISYDLWKLLGRLVEFVCKNWRTLDRGIWEVRGPARHFVHSKVMCWVALDRALRIAERQSFPADVSRWTKIRDTIYEDVMAKGYNTREGSFVQHYGSTITDASSLILPLVKFVTPTDPRMLSTLKRIRETLVSDSLVKRYHTKPGKSTDGLRGVEGSFAMCTFWYVESLARSGDLEEAQWVFEKMLGYSGPLGLFSEEINMQGELTGNFPQAFTHVGLISAAYDLDRALSNPNAPRC